MRFLLMIFILDFLPLTSLFSTGRPAAFEINTRLGRGINIGNTFEAPSESAWGNPWNPDYCRIIYELGFSHIRVPIRWEPAERSMPDHPYTIEPSFLERIKGVVDMALKYNLHVVINMHHHDLLFGDPDGQGERFLAQWDQIAGFFKDYPDSLLFEVLNEPHDRLTPQKWNQFFAGALSAIRNTNPDRIVMMGTAEWGGVAGLQHLELPDDPNLIVTVHYYNPFTFTHQGAEWVDGSDAWLGTRWLDTEAERESVENDFKAAIRFSQEYDVPVHVGEFGAYSAADSESRVRWTTFVSRYIEELGFSWAYWEFSAGFGIYNPSTGQVRQELAGALLHNPMGEPAPTEKDTLYSSDFTGGNDGWSLGISGGAAAGLLNVADGLEVEIADGGTESWNIQLVKTGFAFATGNMYRVSFSASAPGERYVTTYAGRAVNPWNSYSGYNSYSVSNGAGGYSYGFNMNDPPDPSSRIVFDLGKTTTGFKLHSLIVEKITILSSAVPYPAGGDRYGSLRYFPNPVREYLNIHGAGQFSELRIYDIQGRNILSEKFATAELVMGFSGLPPGVYLIRLTGKTGHKSFSVLKL